jgi:hypothetical protein
MPTETYSRVRVGKNLSDIFPSRNGLKQGDALSPLLFNFVLEYAIWTVQVNQNGFKINSAPQLLVYADDINILRVCVHTTQINAEALLVAGGKIGLEVNADKNKYMVKSRDQNAGRSHSTIDRNSIFEMVKEFKYLGTTLTNQNYIQKEIKSGLNSRNVGYHSAQNFLSSSFLL